MKINITTARKTLTILVLPLSLNLVNCKQEKPDNIQSDFTSRPNVILIMADDQGYGDFSCHGNPILKTPALDRLHAESVRFTDFHVAPMCTPTRGQLMTGIDAMRNGATAVCQGRSMMRNDLPIMPGYFAAAGYSTGHFGKWHLGDSYPHRPQDRGFQETIHHPAWGITSLADHFGNSYWDPWLRHNGVEEKFEGYCTDIFFSEAMTWMKEQKALRQPFFLYLPTNTPHVPNWVDSSYAAPYRAIGTYEGTEVPANFYGMIANLDANMAILDQFLTKEDLKENTILIYLTDNGTQSQAAAEIYNAGMRGHKTQVYEGGHRVPLFLRWPRGKLLHGSDIGALTGVQDILVTLIDICKLPKPTLELDGHSLSSILQDSTAELPDRKLVIQYSFGETAAEKWNRAVVLWNKWRLLGTDELYNIANDPNQRNNVIDQYPDIAKSLQDHYSAWYDKTKPIYDQERYIHLGSEKANPTVLYSNDWQGAYCDNPPNLVAANTTGYWDVVIESPGTYEIQLRRWPEESKLALSAGVNGKMIKAYESFSGDQVGARPIAFAQLKIEAFEETKSTSTSDTYANFIAALEPGKVRLETLFLDQDKEVLCSAIYVKVTKL